MRKIRIAHIITRMILGGAQENTLLSVEGLHEMCDYEVHLITGPALGPEGTLLDRAEKKGISVKLIPQLRRNLNPLLDLIAFLKLFVLLRKGKYNIVHTHSSKAGILGRIAAKMAGVKIVVHTIHGLPFHENEKPYLNLIYILLEKIMAVFSDKILTVCPEMTLKALDAGVGNKKLYCTVYSGIRIDSFTSVTDEDGEKIRKKFNIPANAAVVGKIARLFDLKGHKYLMPVAEKIIREFPDTYFLLVGDGVLRETLEADAKKRGIEKNIIFAGLVPSYEVPFYIKAMDIVIHLSLREGLPRVVPEAFLCKRPVIVFDVDGAKDVVEHEINGLLVPACDEKALLEALRLMINDKEKQKKYAQKGFDKAVNVFSHTKMIKDLDSIYKYLYC